MQSSTHSLKDKTQSGFNKMYDACAGKLYAFILNVTEDEAEAEKILSETFCKAWDQTPVISLHDSSPFLFLVQIASSIILEHAGTSPVMRKKIIHHVKSLRTQPTLKVIVPLRAQNPDLLTGLITSA